MSGGQDGAFRDGCKCLKSCNSLILYGGAHLEQNGVRVASLNFAIDYAHRCAYCLCQTKWRATGRTLENNVGQTFSYACAPCLCISKANAIEERLTSPEEKPFGIASLDCLYVGM
jgi:hypothetical protein